MAGSPSVCKTIRACPNSINQEAKAATAYTSCAPFVKQAVAKMLVVLRQEANKATTGSSPRSVK
eukprot:865582-Prorocentrum_lima.AAC.1